MAGVSIDMNTRGVTRLAADLGHTSARATTRAAVVVRKTAYDIERDAKAKCPVDTGYLRNSISTSIGLAGLKATVGPTANYGAFVEYGTSRAGPHPYMGPAVDKNAPAFTRALGQLDAGLL